MKDHTGTIISLVIILLIIYYNRTGRIAVVKSLFKDGPTSKAYKDWLIKSGSGPIDIGSVPEESDSPPVSGPERLPLPVPNK